MYLVSLIYSYVSDAVRHFRAWFHVRREDIPATREPRLVRGPANNCQFFMSFRAKRDLLLNNQIPYARDGKESYDGRKSP